MAAQASSVLTLLRSATSWLLGWALVTFFIELGILGMVSLGSHFGLMVTVVAPLIALPVAILIAKIIARILPQPGELPDAELKRRHRRVTFSIGIILLMMAGIGMAPAVIDHQSRSRDAEAALQSFLPRHAASVDSADLERTLAEFERARHELSDQWLIPKSSPHIILHLFRDLEDYRAGRGLDWSGGYAQCGRDKVTIGVPFEDGSHLLNELPPTRTPLHEMVHAMWCQKLGQRPFYMIPSWFHEGMAERFAYRGFQGYRDRTLNRLAVWVNGSNLLPATEFCSYRPRANRNEIALFYGTSYEFIRSLEAQHGIEHLSAIVDDVSSGMSFDNSLHARLGGTCSELYGEWSQSF